MPYVDTGKTFNEIGHCRRCRGQWVIAPGTKGKPPTSTNTGTGRVCPYCNSQSVRYTKEDNR